MRIGYCLALGLAGAAAWAQPQYEVVDLTKAFGEDFTAVDINNHGVVLGHTRLNFAQDQACIIENGKLTMLPQYQGKHPWYAIGINDNGDVLGAGTLGTNEYRTVLYRNGTVTDLGLPGDVEFPAGRGLNNVGQVVGVIDPPGLPFAFVWENGKTTVLPGLSSGSTGANAINDESVITGFSDPGTGLNHHAVTWTQGVIEDLNPAWARDTMGVAINELNEVAGWGRSLAGFQRGVLWREGKAIDLGDFGGGRSRAYDVNDLSKVVGWGTDSVGLLNGFLWQNSKMARLVDLLDPGHNLAFSWGQTINNADQILAIGGEMGSKGAAHWYVLNPVPEPSSLLALITAISLVTILRRRARRR